MLQLIEESKSLERIKGKYTEDSLEHKDLKEFWKKMQQDKEQHVNELHELIKKYI